MDLFSTQSLFFLSLVFLYLYLKLLTTKTTKPFNKGFRIYPLVGTLPDMLKNQHRFLDWTTETLRDCPTNTALLARPSNLGFILTANPENLEHILKTKFHNYPKGDLFISFLQDLLGKGIFNSDGDLWKFQRKTASYEFNTKSLRNFVMNNVTVQTQTRLFPILSRTAATHTVLDLQDTLQRFSFDNVCMLAFNIDPKCLNSYDNCDDTSTNGTEFMRAFEDALTLSSGRFLHVFPWLWKTKKLLNVGTERRLRESIAIIHNFANEIVQSRLEAKDKHEDLLSRFVDFEENSPEFLRDMIINFIFAGRDSTSSALSWFFWILSSRRDVQQKILEEIQKFRSGKLGGEALGYEELKEMQYLHAAISESMRLYPPVPVDTRLCLNDDILPDGTMVRKGLFVMYHVYAIGRMESVWGKDCTEFKPERWLENGVLRAESPFRFPVFNAGPRTCLGKDLSYVQMKSVVASVLERFEIEALDKDTCPEHLLSLTLRMKGGLPVKVRARERSRLQHFMV